MASVSDADTIRAALSWCEESEQGERQRKQGIAALDRLEAQYEAAVGELGSEAAEARAVAAEQRVAFLVAEAHGWQPKLEAAEAKRDEWINEADRLMGLRLSAEAERDELQAKWENTAYELARCERYYEEANTTAEVAEARVAALEEALRVLLPWARHQTFENDAAWVNAREAADAGKEEGVSAVWPYPSGAANPPSTGVRGCDECNRRDNSKRWPIFTVRLEGGVEVCAKCLTPMNLPRAEDTP